MEHKQKKLLILGANPETASIVQTANEMGYYTIVTDNQPSAYAKRFASMACNVDAMNFNDLANLVKKEKIDGILLGVAEALMPVYCDLCSFFNLPCYGTKELFSIMADKESFKNVCRQYNVPVVQEYTVHEKMTDDEINKILPAVIKPVDSCSSKGISVCTTINDFHNGVKKAQSFSRTKKIIVEKYMTTDEVILYYTVRDRKAALTAMCDRYTNKEQLGYAQLPTAYIFPSRHLSKVIETKTNENICQMLSSIGVNNGTLFLQCFVDGNDVRIYEPGFRLNGAQEHYIVNAISEVDVKKCMVDYAMNQGFGDKDIISRCNPQFRKWGCKLSPLVREGKIIKIKGIDIIKKMDGVISVNPSYDEGNIVCGKGTLKQIVCRFFLVTDTIEKMRQLIDSIYYEFDVIGEDGESMLLEPFNTGLLYQKYSNDFLTNN